MINIYSTSLNLELYDFSVDLTTPDSARTALDMIDEMLSNVSSQLVNIGAAINRLEFVLDEQNIKIENMISTRSTLRDADVAKESANYIRYQILQQYIMICSCANIRNLTDLMTIQYGWAAALDS